MQNWKSFIAFLLFMFLYGYTVFAGKDADVVETTGYVALFAMALIMLRNEALTSVVKSLTEIIKKKMEK